MQNTSQFAKLAVMSASLRSRGPRKRPLSAMSWDDLTVHAGETGLTPLDHQAIEVEFLRREVLFQKEASDAAKDTAIFTMHNAKYMLWSTYALAASAFLQAFALLIPVILRMRGVPL